MIFRISIGLVTFSLLLALGFPARAAGPEERLPAAASLVLVLDQPSEAAVKWAKTALGEMVAGKDFAPFYAALEKGHFPAPLNPKPALGLDWADIGKLKEPAAVALLEAEVKTPAIVILAGGKEDAAEVKRILADAQKYFEGRKAKRGVKKTADGEVVTYELPAAAGEPADVCIHLTQGDHFAATNSAVAADKLQKQWAAGAKGSLAEDVEFQKIDSRSRKMVGEKAVDLRWFVRPIPLAELLQKKRDPKMRGGKDLVALAKKLGVGAISSTGGTCTLTPESGHDYELAGLVLAKRPFKSGMRIMDLQPGKPIPPPAWVEADISSYISWNMDFSTALDGAGDWLGERLDDPGFLNAYLGQLLIDKNVSVRKDIVERLGPGIFEVTDSHRAKDASNPKGERRLIGIHSKEQLKLAKALALVTREDGVAKDDIIAGSPVRSAPDGQPLFSEPDEDAPKNTKSIQAYAITPALALLCTDDAWLRGKLAPQGKVTSLADDGAYKQLTLWSAKQESDKTCLRGFVRSDPSMNIDYDVVRVAGVGSKSSLQAQLLQLVFLGKSPAKEPAAALPKFEALAPHLLPAGVSLAVSPEGFELRAAVLGK